MGIVSYFLLFFLFVILGLNLLLAGYMIFSLFRKNKKAPYVSSFNKEILLMKENLSLDRGKTIVDLGCGDGKALRFFARVFGLIGTGYDTNFWAILLGKLLNRFLRFTASPAIFRQDFLTVDLSKFDYIYVYLLPDQLADIEDWIWKNIKRDAIIIANSFQFSKHKSFKIISNKKGKPSIFLYKK